MEQPVHQHDCDICVFVGADTPQPGEPRVNQVDMYVHPSAHIYNRSLIRRYSSSGPDYTSIPECMVQDNNEKFLRVVEAARMIGVL